MSKSTSTTSMTTYDWVHNLPHEQTQEMEDELGVSTKWSTITMLACIIIGGAIGAGTGYLISPDSNTILLGAGFGLLTGSALGGWYVIRKQNHYFTKELTHRDQVKLSQKLQSLTDRYIAKTCDGLDLNCTPTLTIVDRIKGRLWGVRLQHDPCDCSN